MADSRILSKNKNYLNHNSMNGLFITVYMIALMFPFHIDTFETESNKIRCSNSMTCTKCTIKPLCVWSLEQQVCENKNQFNSSSLIASRIGECPHFSVIKKYHYYDNIYLPIYVDYIVEITNDLVGFINYLNSTIMYYKIQNAFQKSVKIINETKISCPFRQSKIDNDKLQPSVTHFLFIMFNNTMLRFDNVADHYVTVHKHKECATDEKYKSCATCAWNNDGYTNYIDWCSSDNTCKFRKNIYMKNNATEQLDVKLAYVTNDCAEINVTAVDPLSGPKTGGTIVTITVRNHRVFAENRTTMVTVAGTVCENPKTSGLETITCTTSQMAETPSGPVLVEYSSIEGILQIESSQIFQFCVDPVLNADQHLEGVASGGTSVSVRGGHFVEPCVVFFARLYVDLDNGVRRYSDNYCDTPVNDTFMVCRSPRVNGDGFDGDASVVGRLLNFGLDITFIKDKLSFNQSLPISIRGPFLKFYVCPDPVLIDFEIEGNGSVVIYGFHLQHLRPEEIVISSLQSPSWVCVVVSISRHKLVCEPTFATPQMIVVKFSNSLEYTPIRRTSPRPYDPFKFRSWLNASIAIFTVLVFVCVLACCLRTKHQYNVTENIRNLPVAPTESQDLYIHTAL